MAERYAFPIRFEDAEMREAVNAFFWRALFVEKSWLSLAPLALIALSCIGLAVMGEAEDALLLFLGAAVVLGSVAYGGWRMHQRVMREKVDKARGHLATARVLDEGVIIDAGGQAPLLEWKQVKAVWPGDKVWLLIVATNYFIALPIARAPREALAFIEAHVAGQGAVAPQ